MGVADASLQLGREAACPAHQYRILRRLQVPVLLVLPERIRSELESLWALGGSRSSYLLPL
jgi:hypothetical protein